MVYAVNDGWLSKPLPAAALYMLPATAVPRERRMGTHGSIQDAETREVRSVQ
jgi:hypothetical protein